MQRWLARLRQKNQMDFSTSSPSTRDKKVQIYCNMMSEKCLKSNKLLQNKKLSHDDSQHRISGGSLVNSKKSTVLHPGFKTRGNKC